MVEHDDPYHIVSIEPSEYKSIDEIKFKKNSGNYMTVTIDEYPKNVHIMCCEESENYGRYQLCGFLNYSTSGGLHISFSKAIFRKIIEKDHDETSSMVSLKKTVLNILLNGNT